jgi:hypothetical protein
MFPKGRELLEFDGWSMDELAAMPRNGTISRAFYLIFSPFLQKNEHMITFDLGAVLSRLNLWKRKWQQTKRPIAKIHMIIFDLGEDDEGWIFCE